AFPIQILVMSIGQMLGVGAASVISRSLGAGRPERAQVALGNMLFAVTVLSVLITAVGYLRLDELLRLFGATDTILPHAREYMEILLAGTLLHAFAMASNNVIRAEGQARVAMISMLIGAVVNIALDPVFIFGLGWGLAGAAWATVIAKVLAALYVFGYFRSGRTPLSLALRHWRPLRGMMGEIVAIGSSSFVRMAASSVLAVVMNHTLAIHGGDMAIAAFGVINRLLIFMITPLIGLAQGLQPIVGFNHGAGRFDKARRAVRLALASSTAIATAGAALMLAFPTTILGIFSRDRELLAIGVGAVRVVVLTFPLVGIQMVGATLFQAIGRALPALVLSLSRQFIFLLPLLLILPRPWGLNGIWISFPVADLAAVALTLALMVPQLRRFGAARRPA
ncbi:MATE family efflux transporter, partial [bacterium]|nr:MATE family efflux transporter [bacterium]